LILRRGRTMRVSFSRTIRCNEDVIKPNYKILKRIQGLEFLPSVRKRTFEIGHPIFFLNKKTSRRRNSSVSRLLSSHRFPAHHRLDGCGCRERKELRATGHEEQPWVHGDRTGRRES